MVRIYFRKTSRQNYDVSVMKVALERVKRGEKAYSVAKDLSLSEATLRRYVKKFEIEVSFKDIVLPLQKLLSLVNRRLALHFTF
jgi:hypothetical protein